MEWITDQNGNRASVEYFGSRALAQEALETLQDCRDCENCTDCTGCVACTRCAGCEACTACVLCSACRGCEACTACVLCSACRGCEGCSNQCGRERVRNVCRDLPAIPVIDDIHRKVYEAARAPGALDMDRWHRCDTTHCRAGWVVHLAGPEGYVLAEAVGIAVAAVLIYRASGYDIFPVRFYDTNEEALEDMARLARGEFK